MIDLVQLCLSRHMWVCFGKQLTCPSLIFEHAQSVLRWSEHAQFKEILAVAGVGAKQHLLLLGEIESKSGLILFKKALLMLCLETSGIKTKCTSIHQYNLKF